MSVKSSIREEMELDKQRRGRYLEYLIKEAIVNVVAEQQAMPQAPLAADPTAAAQPAPLADPNAPQQQSPDLNPQAPGVQTEEFTLDKMIEKLNVIRGGRSFTDPEIYGQLTTLFKGWDPPTKQTIEKTFDEIAKVVTLNAPGEGQQQQAPNPMDQQPQPTAPPAAPPTAPVTPGAPPAPAGVGF